MGRWEGASNPILPFPRKEWGGLVRSYYKKRYSLLFTMADNALKSKSTWSQAAYDAAVMEQVELPWSNATDPFPNVPEHDLLNIIDGLHVEREEVADSSTMAECSSMSHLPLSCLGKKLHNYLEW